MGKFVDLAKVAVIKIFFGDSRNELLKLWLIFWQNRAEQAAFTVFQFYPLFQLMRIDYDREMAFVAVRRIDQTEEILGVTRAISDPDNIDAEFAVLVRSDLKGLGLGRRLMEKLITYTRDHGLQRLNGITMPNNRGMVALARKLGFNVDIQLEEGIVGLTLNLAQREES